MLHARADEIFLCEAETQQTSFEISSTKQIGPKKGPATMVEICSTEIVGLNQGGDTMTQSSSPISGKILPLCCEREFAEKFSPVIEDLNMHRVSRATGRSIETIKAWRTRRAFPNGASLINAARAFPSVKAWLLDEIAAPEQQPDLSGDITKVLRTLQDMASGNGPYAAMANAVLQDMHKPRGAE